MKYLKIALAFAVVIGIGIWLAACARDATVASHNISVAAVDQEADRA